ncbi:DUF2484 family protein [Jannaschia pohangensis]|uniref:UDP-N-acetylmuramate--alanine ligase n=1 Tax=Jannaschia pohangensis TaxID=390807 RepID=A0A1I3S4J1_9RHOB|nr:DUF2484 family protein [Jannaschia pohangensis]SFJ53714.1 Protein of unknown function [Jannaschia pohangensis]
MAVIAMCLWVIVAWVLMLVLSAKQSWPAAYVLIAFGVPIVIWLGLSMGAVWAIGGAVTMGLVLRWPLRYFLRWLKGLAGR